MDERFVMHRLRSTRLAAIVGAIMIGAWTIYEFRWEKLVIMGAMGVTKWIAMLYYQKTD
jgi:hypothetical protein